MSTMTSHSHQYAGVTMWLLLVVTVVAAVLEVSSWDSSQHEAPRHLQPTPRHLTFINNLTMTWQPNVSWLEETRETPVVHSVALPDGSPWCQGLPTMWLVGHSPDDRPSCLHPDGKWRISQTTVFDEGHDRHGCVALDINQDGLVDIVCSNGAKLGKGFGYTETYLTLPNGTIQSITNDTNVGLQKYPSMRTRLTTGLKGPNGKDIIFIGVFGARPRTDGLYNKHAMFRNDYDPLLPDNQPWFHEVLPGPWKLATEVHCAVAADITGNGVDDLVLCQEPAPPAIFTQLTNGTWQKLRIPQRLSTRRWRNVRIADVTGDGEKDLIAVDQGDFTSKLWIFKGQTQRPYFDFANPWFEYDLPYSAPDVEVLDVNKDGRPDIYAAQSDKQSRYCIRMPRTNFWGDQRPPDKAKDILFLRKAKTDKGGPYWPLKNEIYKARLHFVGCQVWWSNKHDAGHGRLCS